MKSFSEFSESFENLPGKATHLTKVDVRHPEHGIISGSTTLRHLGGNKYEVRAGRAKGKTVALDDKHVQKLSEDVALDEAVKPTSKAAIAYHKKHAWTLDGNIPGHAKYHYDMIKKLNSKPDTVKKSVKEESEQLDELDDKTLQSYRQKAHNQIQHYKYASGKDKPEAGEVLAKREPGMQKATDKVIKKDKERIAALPKREPAIHQPYKPLGGRDEVSGRSYSEEVELDEDFTKMDTPTLKKWITTRERNSMAANLSKKRSDQYDQATAELKNRREVKEEAEQTHVFHATVTRGQKGILGSTEVHHVQASSKDEALRKLHADMKRHDKVVHRAEYQGIKEETEQVDELNQMTLSRYAAKARADHTKDRSKGVQTANRKLRFGEYSEMYDKEKKQ